MPVRKQFRYATLLRVRELQENQKAQELAQTRLALQRAAEERQNIEAEQFHTLVEASAATSEQFDASHVGRYYLYERHLARRAVEKDSEIAVLRKQEEQRRRTLEKASRAKHIVERLKERHINELQAFIAGEEQKASDEVAVNRSAAARERSRES